MDNLFVVVDSHDDRAVLVQAKDREDAIETYISYIDMEGEEFNDDDRKELKVQPVVPQQFSDGVMEIADW